MRQIGRELSCSSFDETEGGRVDSGTTRGTPTREAFHRPRYPHPFRVVVVVHGQVLEDFRLTSRYEHHPGHLRFLVRSEETIKVVRMPTNGHEFRCEISNRAIPSLYSDLSIGYLDLRRLPDSTL